MAPKYNSSDAWNLDMPKTSHKMLLLGENMNVLNKEIKTKLYVEVGKICGKNESIFEIVKKFVIVLLPHLKLQKLWS